MTVTCVHACVCVRAWIYSRGSTRARVDGEREFDEYAALRATFDGVYQFLFPRPGGGVPQTFAVAQNLAGG